MTGELPPDPRTQKRQTPTDKNTIAHTAMEFGRSALSLRNALDEDADFDDMELLLIENHVYVLQLAYLRWKRKHRPSPD